MAIHTFSTRERIKPEDEQMVQDIKSYCIATHQNFSRILLEAIKESKLNERAREHKTSRNGSAS